MDMYVRMYDELKKREDDNPSIGIVLCEETDEDELRREISRQKAIFQLQQKEKAALREVGADE